MSTYDILKDPKAGYCTSHNWQLSLNNIRKRNCLGKACMFLIRLEHSAWKEPGIETTNKEFYNKRNKNCKTLKRNR